MHCHNKTMENKDLMVVRNKPSNDDSIILGVDLLWKKWTRL